MQPLIDKTKLDSLPQKRFCVLWWLLEMLDWINEAAIKKNLKKSMCEPASVIDNSGRSRANTEQPLTQMHLK